ncbi:MAG: hypothetical protein WC707_03915 [Candidatus Babeliaceae bacterium]|jgi:hypothetical protein
MISKKYIFIVLVTVYSVLTPMNMIVSEKQLSVANNMLRELEAEETELVSELESASRNNKYISQAKCELSRVRNKKNNLQDVLASGINQVAGNMSFPVEQYEKLIDYGIVSIMQKSSDVDSQQDCKVIRQALEDFIKNKKQEKVGQEIEIYNRSKTTDKSEI